MSVVPYSACQFCTIVEPLNTDTIRAILSSHGFEWVVWDLEIVVFRNWGVLISGNLHLGSVVELLSLHFQPCWPLLLLLPHPPNYAQLVLWCIVCSCQFTAKIKILRFWINTDPNLSCIVCSWLLIIKLLKSHSFFYGSYRDRNNCQFLLTGHFSTCFRALLRHRPFKLIFYFAVGWGGAGKTQLPPPTGPLYPPLQWPPIQSSISAYSLWAGCRKYG